MANINLLPPDLGPKRSVIKASTIFKKVSIVSFVALLITGAVLAGYFFFTSRQLSLIVSGQDKLKSSINALEQTEQKLFLVKDRLNYVKLVKSENQIYERLEEVDAVMEGVSGSVSISTVNVFKDGFEVDAKVASSKDVSTYFSYLVSTGEYQQVELIKLAFSAREGYTTKLKIVK